MLFAVATVAFDTFGEVHLSTTLVDTESPEAAEALCRKMMTKATRSTDPDILTNAIAVRLTFATVTSNARFTYDETDESYNLTDAAWHQIERETVNLPDAEWHEIQDEERS